MSPDKGRAISRATSSNRVKTPEFPSLSRIPRRKLRPEFQPLLVLCQSYLMSNYYGPSLPWTLGMWTRAGTGDPAWSKFTTSKPSHMWLRSQLQDSLVCSKSTEVRTQPFPVVWELVIFFLCWWGQLLSHSSTIKLSKILKSLLLLITVSVLHTLIISPWHRQWSF